MVYIVIVYLITASGQEYPIVTDRSWTETECRMLGDAFKNMIEPYSDNKIRVTCTR